MDELDDIRLRKLQDMQESQSEALQMQQQVQQLEAAVKGVMTRDALQRYGNIKAASPEKAVQLLVVIGQLLHSGQIKGVDDEMLKSILLRIQPEKKDFKIRRV